MIAAFAIDSSAVVAILNGEAEAHQFLTAIDQGQSMYIGWPTAFEIELWLVRARRNEKAKLWFDNFLAMSELTVEPFDGRLERRARHAAENYGKGLHPAALNFGDCMTYAVAAQLNLPLLFKGADFGKTDLVAHSASVVIA
jgi:ribonuclease VapC